MSMLDQHFSSATLIIKKGNMLKDFNKIKEALKQPVQLIIEEMADGIICLRIKCFKSGKINSTILNDKGFSLDKFIAFVKREEEKKK